MQPQIFLMRCWSNGMTRKREQFGAQRWEHVQLVLAALRGRYGIYLLDVNPGNITFAEREE